jgi:DNA polymerase bacteriophage-type
MLMMGIDIETYSSNEIKDCGVYKYAQADDFEILLLSYALDNSPVNCIDLAAGDELSKEVMEMLFSPEVNKNAWNANFEITCLSAMLKKELPAVQWTCTMAKAAMLGLPLGLDNAAKALRIEQEKLSTGKALIRYFSVPCKPTKTNGGRTRNLPEHAPDKWQQYKDYNRQDVVVEKTIREKISFFNIPETEKKLWRLDQKINTRGILVDPRLVHNAIDIDNAYREMLTREATELTGLENPNSVSQLKQWLTAETQSEVKSLSKDTIPALLIDTDKPEVVRVLKLRQEMSKTSVKKYEAMSSAVCSDNRIRGLLQYYGANRTGRWAGRLVQVQNLPKNQLNDLDLARNLVLDNDLDLLTMLFGNVPDTLSQLIRTAFVPAPNHRFIIADFSAIEARVIAWLAGERWRIDVFNTHGKIYEASAAQMFKVPMSHITKGSDLRQKGKVSELALGYQGGPNALIKMGALSMGLVEEELPKLVSMWRNANKAIVRYWDTVGEAALICVRDQEPQIISHGIKFFMEKGILFIQLPSGRRLSYLRPKLVVNTYGQMTLTYEGMDQTTKQWKVQDTYGGKLVENIVQAVARDCLADAMLRLDEKGYNIAIHVHDEIVAEVENGKGSLAEVNTIMSQPISWAKGLPLRADSYESNYYKKD